MVGGQLMNAIWSDDRPSSWTAGKNLFSCIVLKTDTQHGIANYARAVSAVAGGGAYRLAHGSSGNGKRHCGAIRVRGRTGGLRKRCLCDRDEHLSPAG